MSESNLIRQQTTSKKNDMILESDTSKLSCCSIAAHENTVMPEDSGGTHSTRYIGTFENDAQCYCS